MKKKKWFRLDNAALIFPAIMKRRWNNVFRISVSLTGETDPEALSLAVENLKGRFPSFFVRLRTGFFWYYLEEINGKVPVVAEYAYPLTHMSRAQLSRSCILVLYYGNRFAVEFFHSVTDGTGGAEFVKNLTAEYLRVKYRVPPVFEGGIVDPAEEPDPVELADRFPECAGGFPVPEEDTKVFRMRGTPEPDRFRHLTTGIVPTGALIEAAHRHGVTVTAFLAAVMAEAVARLQDETLPRRAARPVRIMIPVNLRRLFGVTTLRNFVLTVTAGFDPRLGEYSFDEICSLIRHSLAITATRQHMAAKIEANVRPAENRIIRAMPLFIKNPVMRMVYHFVGERVGCINVSNLGSVSFPGEYAKFVERFEFIIGVQYSYPNNCSVVSCGGRTFINMIRSTKESELERLFFARLVELGLPVEIESNRRR
ncbi:MAG: hypothetical protein ILO42_02445 [Clostridia bacterium]|nr:hypothetical protein [Clostridia bacterium]